MRIAGLLSLLLLTACGAATSSGTSGVALSLYDYSPEFQGRAAAELEAAPRPCDRDEAADDCSALARMVIDYGVVRNEIRVLNR